MGNGKPKFTEGGLEIAKDLLQKLIVAPIEEVGLLAADQVRFWRLKNQVKILVKADEYLRRYNINPKRISLKILVPLLEGASLEEEENLQEMWVALLVNYVSTEQKTRTTIYPYILSQISTKEAQILEFVNEGKYSLYKDFYDKFGDITIDIDNLLRLSLIYDVPEQKTMLGFENERVPGLKNDYFNCDYYITELGKEFINACTLQDSSASTNA